MGPTGKRIKFSRIPCFLKNYWHYTLKFLQKVILTLQTSDLWPWHCSPAQINDVIQLFLITKYNLSKSFL